MVLGICIPPRSIWNNGSCRMFWADKGFNGNSEADNQMMDCRAPDPFIAQPQYLRF